MQRNEEADDMSSAKDDLFGNDPEFEELADAIERHGEAVYRLVLKYAEEQKLSDGLVSDLAFEAGVRLRMMAYVLETAKPSGGGLKLDLDRCRRELDDTFREHKKMADEFVRMAKAAIDELAADDDADEGEEQPNPK
jgi:hypothetical protein